MEGKSIQFFLKSILMMAVFASGHSLFAQSIISIKQSSVKIALEEMKDVAQGLQVFAIDSNGKKKAVIEIESVEDDVALGKILKGKAQKGYKIARPEDLNKKNLNKKTTELENEDPKEVSQNSEDEDSELSSDSKTESAKKKTKSFSRKEGLYGLFGLRYALANQTAENVKVPGGFVGSTGANSVVTGTGFGFSIEGGYRFSEFLLGLDYRSISISWNKDNSDPVAISEFGLVAKYLTGELAIAAGVYPSTSLKRNSSAVAGSCVSFGASYALSKWFDIAFEYRVISVADSLLIPSHFGFNFVY